MNFPALGDSYLDTKQRLTCMKRLEEGWSPSASSAWSFPPAPTSSRRSPPPERSRHTTASWHVRRTALSECSRCTAYRSPSHGRPRNVIGSPRRATFSPQTSHLLATTLTAHMNPLVHPPHHRTFRSAGSPKCGTFRPQLSPFLVTTSSAPTCAFAQSKHQRTFPSTAKIGKKTLYVVPGLERKKFSF